MNPNMQRQPVIYGLYDADGNCGYIGSTKVNPKTRWWEHRSRARQNHPAPVYQWMRSVGIESVQIQSLCDIPSNIDSAELETRYIKEMLDAGHPIQNQIGRDGRPRSNAERMKRLVSQKKKGKPTWIKGKRGAEAGWTEERRRRQAETIRLRRASQ